MNQKARKPVPSFTKMFQWSNFQLRVLDVGAAFNEDARYRALIEAGHAHVWAVDANPGTLKKIHKTQREHYTILPHVIGAGQEVVIHFCDLPQMSSIYLPNYEIIRRFKGLSEADGTSGAFKIRKKAKVTTKRLDDILSAPVDYIKLDIQGAELDALRGAERLLKEALIIECEVEFVPLYLGQPLYHDVAAFLSERGFFTHKMIDIQGRPFHGMQYDKFGMVSMSQSLWCDTVFIRSDIVTHPERLSDDQLYRAAVILHDFYASYDLVNALIGELEKRHDKSYSKPYMDILNRSSSKRIYFNTIDKIPPTDFQRIRQQLLKQKTQPEAKS